MKLKCFIGCSLLTAAALAVSGSFAFADNFDATTQIVGRDAHGLETPVNQQVSPAGIQVNLRGIRPNALALSPDGQCLVTSGLRRELIVVDPATGKIRQHVPLPEDDQLPPSALVSEEILEPESDDKLSFTGLAFSPDGSRIYLSNVNGDIKVFAVGKHHEVTALFSLPLPAAHAAKRDAAIPTGIAVSPDGKRLYVALNLANRLAELDAASGRVLREWNVGVEPYAVVLCRNKVYVSNWGGRRPDPASTTGDIGLGTRVRTDWRSVASEGSVSVIDLNGASKASSRRKVLPARRSDQDGPRMKIPVNGQSDREILTGRHACALALSPNGKYLVCANAGDDTLSVIDTRTDKIVETLCARQNPADLFGAQPDALVFDRKGRRLFVCNGTQNAVAVFQFQYPSRMLGLIPVHRYRPGKAKLIGLIPVGWFPGSIAYDTRRDRIDVANIKSIGPGRRGPAGKTRFNSRQLYGSLSLVPLPSSRELKRFTQTALDDLRYPLLERAKLPARPNQPPRPVPERVGEPSVFKHVVYIIKENRTYDQVFGDVKRGNGFAPYCTFGERVTPNQHRLVRDFVVLDNTYCCGILSADGHQWTDCGITTEYLERQFAGWPRTYGGGSLTYSPAGFIWNAAAARGLTLADFGEFTAHQLRWRNPRRQGVPSWLDCYHDFLDGSNQVDCYVGPGLPALRPYYVTNYPGFELHIPDVWRAAVFLKTLKRYEAEGRFPNLVIACLPDDHTSGTRFGSPTPEAQVADNDLAFGQIVEALSHSPFWTNTCIFAVEDDPQGGWDHVSGYRTTAYVASPYTKRHAVIHTQYNQTSILRTVELILGIPPMNQMDATATPMFDCFTATPDFTPFTAVTNQVPLDEMNPSPKAIADPILRHDALVSAKLPLAKEDQCPEDLFNHILWHAAKGSQAPYPASAVTEPDDD